MRLLIAILLLITLNGEAQIIRAHPLYRPLVSAGCDADAQRFIDSTGITDSTQKAALCTLVRELKDSSLWSSMSAIYPFIGGTASSHKWNLKDPRDTDDAFRLTFSGTWTHTSNGATPNGASGTYANTYLIPNAVLTISNTHQSYYSRTNNAGGISIGAMNVSGVTDSAMILACKTYSIYSHSDMYSDNNGGSSGTGRAITGANYNSAAFFLASRTSSTSHVLYRNATNIAQSSGSVSGKLPILPIYLGGFSGTVPSGYDNTDTKQVAFATIGAGLTSDQARALNTIVEKFNDALGRGVQ